MALNSKIDVFDLDLTPGGAPSILHCSQGDVGRKFKANLFWDGESFAPGSGVTCELRGKKPDNTVFQYSETITSATVSFETTEQMTIVSGPVKCELVFTENSVVIATANFLLIVEETTFDPNALSESDIPTIGDLIEETIGGDIRDEVDALIEANPELMLQDNAVTTPKLADRAITTEKLASGAVTERTLSEELNNEIKSSEKHKLVFMPVPFSVNGLNSDCTIIKTVKGKTIMFDTGRASAYSVIVEELEKAEITHIDFLIISHYHDDHYDNIGSLITDNYLSANSTVYLPKCGAIFPAYSAIETSVISALTVANVSYIKPDANDGLQVEDIDITFFNCSDADMTYYDSIPITDTNDYSMCCNVVCGDGFVFGVYGDIGTKAQKRVFDGGYLIKNDISKIPHHGNDQSQNNDFTLATMPDIGVVMQTAWLLEERLFSGFAFNVIPSYGGKVYSTGYGALYGSFNKNGYFIEPNGADLRGGGNAAITINVDGTYTGASDGSSARPCSSLLQALGFSKKFQGISVVIEGKNSYSDSEEILLRTNGNQLTLKNVETGKITAYAGAVLNFDNVTLNGPGDALVANGAIISGDNVSITASGTRGIVLYNSKAIFETVTISNKTTAFACLNGSTAEISTLNGSGNTYGINASNGSTVYIATNNISATHAWDRNEYIEGGTSSFSYDFSTSKTSVVTSADKMNVIRRNVYSVVQLSIAVTLTSGVEKIAGALPETVRTYTPQRVPIVGRSGGAYATANNYIGELFINNANEVYLVFGNNYSSVKYIDCECVMLNN